MNNFFSRLKESAALSPTLKKLVFEWEGDIPRAGQFFMLRAEHGKNFLARPFGAAGYSDRELLFFIEERGEGTAALCSLGIGGAAEITGPLGKSFLDLAPDADSRRIAFVAGGTGIAPLFFTAKSLSVANAAKAASATGGARAADGARGGVFFAGFKTGEFFNEAQKLFNEIQSSAGHFVFASEDGVLPQFLNSLKNCRPQKGYITDGFNAADFDLVLTCGPPAMMSKVAALCAKAKVRCLVSMERKMACGVGACLGCSIGVNGKNLRCCADGPVFDSGEINWDV